jgi:hypothetical protein
LVVALNKVVVLHFLFFFFFDKSPKAFVKVFVLDVVVLDQVTMGGFARCTQCIGYGCYWSCLENNIGSSI